ncbi:hypothetical protein EB796_022739 [Bugula neritina]|uniref:Disease resistance R13L4/SHOC-2-like LRR domain-containing protein n=1 Tax=Bugula neritina TaxID=10212 RepID=A0A7J7IZY5_BUGNE|nr:hypothetical protein EB796_022739 [Bugula neritina]
MYIHYSLSQLTHLHTLVVSGNKLETLPEVIPKMESLTELHLCGCHLHTLPDSLSQLTHLHTLDVSANKLETLPEVIPKMESLAELNLHDW